MLLSKLCSAALLTFATTSIFMVKTASAEAKHSKDDDPSLSSPNILFIFTDDQDSRLNSLDYMPNLQKYLVKEGTIYRNHYATIALCCPSRVSLLRGQYSHNTNITDVSAPYGGYDKFSRLGLGDDYLPIWMQKAGYKTYYYGKLMNGYTTTNYNNTPKGFDHQEQLVDPYTYVYDTAVFSVNGEYPVYHDGVYQTDVIHSKALGALLEQRNQTKPFFLWVAPMAPHGQFEFINGSIKMEPAVPAARHKHLFKDVKVPRTPNFNPAKQHKTASYWKYLDRLNDTLVEKLDENYRDRLRALQAVDEMIGSLFQELEHQGKLNNTYVIYSADNGYHLGQHRAYPGKCANIEEDINVPFIVRGPGVPKNKISDIVSAHHDIAPTLLALAKREDLVPNWVDGGVIPLTKDLARSPNPVSKESFAVEFWGDGASTEGSFPKTRFLENAHNTYKTLRVIAPEYNYMYAVWCTGDHELYDLKKDEYEINDIYNKTDQRLIDRLDALLAVLQTCRAHTCRDPWRALHPNDKSVKTLKDALHPRYDSYYKLFRKVGFQGCEIYYNAANEFPQPDSLFLANTSGSSSSSSSYRPSAKFITQNASEGYVKRQVIEDHQEHAEAARLYSLLRTHATGTTGQESPVAAGLPLSQGTPVPHELTEKPIDWNKYGFYAVGS